MSAGARVISGSSGGGLRFASEEIFKGESFRRGFFFGCEEEEDSFVVVARRKWLEPAAEEGSVVVGLGEETVEESLKIWKRSGEVEATLPR